METTQTQRHTNKPVVNFTNISWTTFFSQVPFTNEIQTVSRGKLQKTLLYKKAARKILMKLTPACQK